MKIRVIVMLLNDNDFFDGEQIKYEHPTGTASLIRGNSLNQWLKGDLFGPLIALSFRASGVPSDAIVVVDDALVQLLGATERSKPFNGDRLHFGPALAFSPFKGLYDLYPFGKKQTALNRGPWDGHLFLRMLSTNKDDVTPSARNPLLLDQQKTRIFTELVWLHDAQKTDYLFWKRRLIEEEGNAGYIREIRAIRKAASFVGGVAFLPPQSDSLLMVGAYPNHDAYEKIREAIEEIKRSTRTGFAYPVTTEVHVPSRSFESDNAFWTLDESPKGVFVLAFARWIESARLNTAETARLTFDDAISTAGSQLKRVRCGLVKGGLWDIYCIINVGREFPGNNALRADIFEKLWNVLDRRSIQGVVFKVCTKV